MRFGQLRRLKLQNWLPLLVGVCFFFLYTAMAAPSIVELFDDSLELQLVAPTFGIAHPTGYPLYVILGGVWSRLLLPVGNWAWRMNLFSALAAAATVALVFGLARQLNPTATGKSSLGAGFAAALTFGVGSLWSSQATVAEVYALHGFFVVAILSVALRIGLFGCGVQNSEFGLQFAPPPSPRALHSFPPSLFHLFTLIGLALAHHRTTVLLLPALALYLLWSVPDIWRPRRVWLGWLAALLAPLLLYLWLPLRAAQGVLDLHGSYVHSWQGFWEHVLASQYTGFFADNALAQPRTGWEWLTLWREQMGWPALLMGGVGLLTCWGRGRQANGAWVLLLLVMVTNGVFALTYRVHDAEVFLLPALLLFALFVGAGVGLIGRLAVHWPNLTLGAQVVMLLVLAFGMGRAPLINRSGVWAIHDYAVAVATVDFPPNSHLVGLEGETTALRYMQAAEGLGRNATAVVADDPEQRRRVIRSLVATGFPTYITREVAGIAREYSFTGDGPLVRVWPRGQAQTPDPQVATNLLFANGQLRLEGYDLVTLAEAGGPTLRIAFYWRPLQPLTQTLKLSLRLQTPGGEPMHWADGRAVQADHFPLRLVANTTDWLPGEQIRDVHFLPIPAESMSQPAQLVLILYDAENLAEAGMWRVDLTW